MTSSGESFSAEPAPIRPSREYQREVLETMQVAHSLRLRDEGTIDRALAAISEDWRDAIGEQPAVHLWAVSSPQDDSWVNGIRFPDYRTADDGSIVWSPGWVMPISEEAGGELVSVNEGFEINDAVLLRGLRDEIVEARDAGILPDLGMDLTYIL